MGSGVYCDAARASRAAARCAHGARRITSASSPTLGGCRRHCASVPSVMTRCSSTCMSSSQIAASLGHSSMSVSASTVRTATPRAPGPNPVPFKSKHASTTRTYRTGRDRSMHMQANSLVRLASDTNCDTQCHGSCVRASVRLWVRRAHAPLGVGGSPAPSARLPPGNKERARVQQQHQGWGRVRSPCLGAAARVPVRVRQRGRAWRPACKMHLSTCLSLFALALALALAAGTASSLVPRELQARNSVDTRPAHCTAHARSYGSSGVG